MRLVEPADGRCPGFALRLDSCSLPIFLKRDEMNMAKIPVGLQLYTLRDVMETDFRGTLRQVAEMGYQFVEFAGNYGGMTAKELKSYLDELGLKAPSAHVGLNFGAPDQIEADLAKQIEYAKELGMQYIVLPWAPIGNLATEEELNQFLSIVRKAAEQVTAAGLKFAYHNHDFEFKQINGKYIMDHMLETIGADLLSAELDLGWVHRGGLKPVEYALKYKGRVPLVHVKDFTADNQFAEVGNGVVDFASVFAAAEEIGIQYYIVEQDQCSRSSLESVKISIDNLKRMGIA
jgi:sugar phosphate isomerase/epimerase